MILSGWEQSHDLRDADAGGDGRAGLIDPGGGPGSGFLDAQVPGSHRYTIEVWFLKKDKPGTFQSRFFDPSIPGQYDVRPWEDFRTRMNDPKVAGISRKIEFTTREGVRETERRQIEALIKQERDRVEIQDPKVVDIPPSRREPTRDAGKTRTGHDEKAMILPKRSLTDQDLVGCWVGSAGGREDPMIQFTTGNPLYPDGRHAVFTGLDPVYGNYKINGNRITFKGSRDFGYIKEMEFDGTWDDDVIHARVRESYLYSVKPRKDVVRDFQLIKMK